MIIISNEEAPQSSDAWKMLRLGIPTASCFDKIITSTGKSSTQRKAYMNKLLGEWMTGEPTEGYKGEWMERGNMLEGEARNLYELVTDAEVYQVSLIYKDDRRLVAASPDGLSGYDVVKERYDKGYETKCPMASTHVEYLLANKLPTKYKVQVQGGMYVTGLDYWDFQSYYPGMPPLIIRVERDTLFIKILDEEIECFLDEMLEKREQLETLK